MVDEAELSVDARFPSAEGLRAALSSIRSEKKQMCVVVFSGDGLTVKWESESKAMQSGIFLGRGVSTIQTYSLQFILNSIHQWRKK